MRSMVEAEGRVRVAAAVAYALTFGLLMLQAPPAAAQPGTSSPPTTDALHEVNKQATKALQPLLIFGGIIVVLSAITGELTHRKRRRRKAKHRSRPRRPSKGASTSPARRSRRSQPSQPAVTQQPVAPFEVRAVSDIRVAVAEAGRMWGRTPGGSAAQRAAELDRERANWAAGGSGEQQVAAELARLPADEWWVFHDLPRGASGTNVDHLVIGVGGVFTLNTKNLSGNVWVGERTVMVAGVKTNFLPVAVSEARDVGYRLSGALTIPIDARPLLVFVHPITVVAMPPDVTVLDLDNLRTWLQSLSAVLTPQQAYDVVLVTDRPTTWL
jgi:hypothetical protein